MHVLQNFRVFRPCVLQKRLSSATRVASTRVKFIAAQSPLTLSNHFFLGLPLVRDPSVRPNNAICGNPSAGYETHDQSMLAVGFVGVQCLHYVHIPLSVSSRDPDNLS